MLQTVSNSIFCSSIEVWIWFGFLLVVFNSGPEVSKIWAEIWRIWWYLDEQWQFIRYMNGAIWHGDITISLFSWTICTWRPELLNHSKCVVAGGGKVMGMWGSDGKINFVLFSLSLQPPICDGYWPELAGRWWWLGYIYTLLPQLSIWLV